jgi:prepilin-type N-terminal cleavage/methylation domain-containing protein
MSLIQKLRHKYGFTLIELIMTIVVVGLIAVPLSISLTEQVQGVVQSSASTSALNLARFEMEVVNNLAYTNIASASFANYQGYPYDIDRTVAYVQGSAASAESLKSITVSVKKAGSATVLVSLVTYIAKNLSYGL